MDETAEPKGLNMLSQEPSGGKRKEFQHKDNQPRTKRRKKMKYETLEEDWGLGAGEDLERLEMEDTARRKFLMDGRMDKLTSSNSRQTTIRVWTKEESMCRKMLENLVEEIVKKSTFMNSLKDDLETNVCRKHGERKNYTRLREERRTRYSRWKEASRGSGWN